MKIKFVETEHSIQNLIKNYMQLKGWYCMRLNSGKIPMTDWKGKKRMIWMGETGTPDLMCFKAFPTKKQNKEIGFSENYVLGVKLLFIEVKRKGNKPTLLQKMKMDELREFGAKCIVATGIEDLESEGIV